MTKKKMYGDYDEYLQAAYEQQTDRYPKLVKERKDERTQQAER